MFGDWCREHCALYLPAMKLNRLSATHMPALDGVRGIAILTVMIHHMTVFVPETEAQRFFFAVTSGGWIGVELFFVLSGMLITGILLDSRDEPFYFRNFYARRVLRIFPLYYLLLVVSFYVLPLFPHPKIANFSRVMGDEVWYWLFLSNFSSAVAGGPRHGIMDVTWSLAIEEQFYHVWPMIVLACGRRRLAQIATTLFCTSVLCRLLATWFEVSPWTIYVVTPTRLDGLCCGALLAIALRGDPARFPHLLKGAWWALLGGLLVTCLIALREGGLIWDRPLVQTLGFAVFAIMFAGLIGVAVLSRDSQNAIDRALRARWLVNFGLYSYALYLFHLPVRAFVRDVVLKPGRFADFPGGILVAQTLFYLLSTGIALVLAWISFRLFESRFLKLKPRFEARVMQRPVVGLP